MMLLGALTATAQLPQALRPQVLEGGFHWKPNIKSLETKPFLAARTQVNGPTDNAVVTNARKVQFKEDAPTHQVNCVLDFNTESQSVNRIFFLSPEHGNIGFFDVDYGTNTLDVPEGTYDIVVKFQQNDPFDEEWVRYYIYVIREQVTIDQDMELNFAVSEAKNHIHFQTLTIDGVPAFTGDMAIDENWNVTVLEEANTDDVICNNVFYCEDYGILEDAIGNFAQTVVGPTFIRPCAEPLFDFYVNDVSDRWVFYSYRVAIQGLNVYTSAYEARGASGDITVSNDPSKFQLFEDPFIATNHLGEELTPGFYFSAGGMWQANNLLYEDLTEGSSYKVYLSASPEDSETGFVPIIEPFVIDENYTVVLQSVPLTVSNGQAIFANNGFANFSFEYSEVLDEYGRDITILPSWPTHPVFSYPVEKKKDNLGNNCPFVVTNPFQYLDKRANVRYFNFDFTYRGRYGEAKEGSSRADVKMKLDGNDLLIADGAFSTPVDELLNGVVDASIVKEGVLVDDMEGSNKAQLHYTAGAEDQNPPTVTMLNFIDANGDVTDRFATADEGTLQFSAGDFNLMATPKSGIIATYSRLAPETVEVSYSPYGEDNWNELAVEEVPENYWPVMGWFYTGSLAGVTGQGLNGWFDLKIRLTDAAGNWQEQVLSPAFRIDDLAYSSVASVGSSNAHEVARYNLAGQRVDANTSGVAIVRMSDGTARKVIVP